MCTFFRPDTSIRPALVRIATYSLFGVAGVAPGGAHAAPVLEIDPSALWRSISVENLQDRVISTLPLSALCDAVEPFPGSLPRLEY